MDQQSLFEETPPRKIVLIRNFISAKEEGLLVEKFAADLKWQKIKFRGVIAKRRVAHFGLDYIYEKRAVKETDPPPAWLNFLTQRVAKLLKINPHELKEILVTYYPEGSGIGWHTDAEVFGDAIVGVSFLNECVMNFRNPKTKEKYKLYIPPRSAYIFADDARYEWEHSITSHKRARYSVTFRTL